MLFVCVLVLGTSAQAQFKFGAGVGFLDSSFGVGAKAHNTFSDDFAGQASFHYYFESAITVYSLDFDLHYSGFDLGDVESFALTPFAGLNLFRVGIAGFGATATSINLGVNGTMPLTDSLDLYVEPKLTIGDNTAFGIAAGVYF